MTRECIGLGVVANSKIMGYDFERYDLKIPVKKSPLSYDYYLVMAFFLSVHYLKRPADNLQMSRATVLKWHIAAQLRIPTP